MTDDERRAAARLCEAFDTIDRLYTQITLEHPDAPEGAGRHRWARQVRREVAPLLGEASGRWPRRADAEG